jgi:hypothetical protein
MDHKFYQTDEELNEAIQQLNLLFDVHCPYKATTALKDHVDEFGVGISRGQTYYRREIGWGIANESKLSVQSMEQLCRAILFDNPYLVNQLKSVQRPLRSSSEYIHIPDNLKAEALSTKFPPAPAVGSRVWTVQGYWNHGPAAGPRVDIAPCTGGTIVQAEQPFATMEQCLYVVQWDDEQSSKHYCTQLFCVGRFATYADFEAAIKLKGEIQLVLGPEGGFREASLSLTYDGVAQDVRLEKDDGILWNLCLKPLAVRAGINIHTTQLAPKPRSGRRAKRVA